MDKNKDYFPSECRGCGDDCSNCAKTKDGRSLAEIRGLALKRKLKLRAIARIELEVRLLERELEAK